MSITDYSNDSTKMESDYLRFKFLTLGDSGVGKTSLLNRYVAGTYNDKLAPTLGVDIRDKYVYYKSMCTKPSKLWKIHLALWDTAGQERLGLFF
ncbi:unnamed protein product [Didymodactylos carnosus]|uniref:Uncharacterized protein n=1 Tax=Didymodactylos carnosus TaxID=1234261 RepID=A0A814GD25_9BILA|nr:unnamed protein product [Didymodactylos carnosus]CAF0994206.1 unnamed protein product [Didymodactylos carnosus]CAF3608884.1 unnamed protein product [Didymodactylos carnosus]CAF3765935.1 unnamed protein product [Didymodactylos carnosus]